MRLAYTKVNAILKLCSCFLSVFFSQASWAGENKLNPPNELSLSVSLREQISTIRPFSAVMGCDRDVRPSSKFTRWCTDDNRWSINNILGNKPIQLQHYGHFLVPTAINSGAVLHFDANTSVVSFNAPYFYKSTLLPDLDLRNSLLLLNERIDRQNSGAIFNELAAIAHEQDSPTPKFKQWCSVDKPWNIEVLFGEKPSGLAHYGDFLLPIGVDTGAIMRFDTEYRTVIFNPPYFSNNRYKCDATRFAFNGLSPMNGFVARSATGSMNIERWMRNNQFFNYYRKKLRLELPQTCLNHAGPTVLIQTGEWGTIELLKICRTSASAKLDEECLRSLSRLKIDQIPIHYQKGYHYVFIVDMSKPWF